MSMMLEKARTTLRCQRFHGFKRIKPWIGGLSCRKAVSRIMSNDYKRQVTPVPGQREFVPSSSM